MLPPRWNGWFFSAGLDRDLRDWSGKLDWKWSGHGEVVQATVSVPEREYELRRRQLAGEPHEDAVHRPLTLHLSPVSATPSNVRTIGALRNHAFDVGQRQPGLREFHVIGLIDDLQTRITLIEQASKLAATGNERLAHPRDTCKP
jgi:hypothetical protein